MVRDYVYKLRIRGKFIIIFTYKVFSKVNYNLLLELKYSNRPF